MRSTLFAFALLAVSAGTAYAAPVAAGAGLEARQYTAFRGGDAYTGNTGNVNGGNAVLEGSRTGTITNSASK